MKIGLRYSTMETHDINVIKRQLAGNLKINKDIVSTKNCYVRDNVSFLKRSGVSTLIKRHTKNFKRGIRVIYFKRCYYGCNYID